MEFRIQSVPVPVKEEVAPGVRKLAAAPKLIWRLIDKQGTVYCRSGLEFDTEAEARSDITAFKRTVSRAVRYAKVTSEPMA
jgi:hypothetical protein